MSDIGQPEDLLRDLETKLISSNLTSSGDDVANILDQLAAQLRSSEVRERLSTTSLPKHLSKCLTEGLETTNSSSSSIIEQVGRVAANLSANNDTGRNGLIDAGYIDECCRALDIYSEAIQASLVVIKALIASLLNMVIEGHEPSLESLSKEQNCTALRKVARKLMLDYQGGEDEEKVLNWTWNILGLIMEEHPNDEHLPDLILPFELYKAGNSNSVHLQVMSSAADVLETWTNLDNLDSRPYCTAFSGQKGSNTIISSMIEFVLTSRLPSEDSDQQTATVEHEEVVDTASKEEEEEEEAISDEKTFANIKGSLINAIVGLSSTIPPSYEYFWSTMRSWLKIRGRDDLVCCALLAFGNRARGDQPAIDLLSNQDDLLSTLLGILQKGITAQVSHSIIGLFRNLSIPDVNKILLGKTDLLDKLLIVGVWSKEKDLLGSVQGGSVGIVKNLCRNNFDNTEKVINHPEIINQVLDLLERTDDPAIRFESTRIFINCIRTICTGKIADNNLLDKLENERIIMALIRMFNESGPYPVLANESIIALALLITFGSNEKGLIIQNQLKLNLDRMVDILAPKEDAEAEVAGKEVKSNLITLLNQCNVRLDAEESLLEVVKKAIDAVKEGRVLSEEALAL